MFKKLPFIQQRQTPVKPKEKRCKIITKKKPDGSVTYESTNCSPEQMKALQSFGLSQEDKTDEGL